MIDIKVGQIFKVKNDIIARDVWQNDKVMKLKAGSHIEIRYPYAWHVRDDKDRYIYIKPEQINQNCEYVGQIFENIRVRNKHTLKQILKMPYYS